MICGEIVDSTIIQFDNLSPYDKYKIGRNIYKNDSYKSVENEID